MTGGWAATNTLRGCITRVVEAEDGHPAIVVGRTSEDEADAALALVETALDAAETRVEYGHNDTCDMELSESEDCPCSCGHDALAAALRAVREGK